MVTETISEKSDRVEMTQDEIDDIADGLVNLTEAPSWMRADFLVEKFPVSEWGEGDQPHVNTGIHAELEKVCDSARRRKGVVWKGQYLAKVRRTAIKFPEGTRVPSTSFRAHRLVRDQAELQKWLRAAERVGTALTSNMVQRYRADEKRQKEGPKALDPIEKRFARQLKTLAVRIWVGSYKINRDDWWNAEWVDKHGEKQGFTTEKRATLVRLLRGAADTIERQDESMRF